MSTESLAARLGRILTKNPESDGLLDGQVEEFLSLYDQVPSSVKADREQLETLLDRSRYIARQFDEYDMPRFTVNVQGFKFNPPNIQSELPCHLEFRILPGTGKQVISVQDASSKPIATSGLLDPKVHSTFTTTICNPGYYVFTSEIYPFMAGQLTATGPAALADASSGDDAEQPVAARKPLPHSGSSHQLSANKPLSQSGSSSQLAGSKPLPHSNSSNQLAGKGQPQQLLDQQVLPQRPGRQDVGDAARADVSNGAKAATAAQPFKSVSFAEPPPEAFPGRVSDASDGLANQPSETGMLELLSLGATPPQPQQQPSTQHVSYQSELSRAGRYARRATLYDDELDGGAREQPAAQQGSSSSMQDAVGAAAGPPDGAQHISYQGELSRVGPFSRRATKYDDELDRDVGAATTLHEDSQADIQQLQPSPATAAQQQGHVSYHGELSRAGRLSRRATEYGNELDRDVGAATELHEDSQPVVQELQPFPATAPQQQGHVSYHGELSRAGRRSRRATEYGNELDRDVGAATALHEDSQPVVQELPSPAAAPQQQEHISYQGELSRAGRLSRCATKYNDELDRDMGAATTLHEDSQAGVQELQPSPAAAPQQQGHVSYQGELSRAGRLSRRATNYGDVDDLADVQVSLSAPGQHDSSTVSTLAGLTAAGPVLQHPQQGEEQQQGHVSYQGELSRAGRLSRRATNYGDVDDLADVQVSLSAPGQHDSSTVSTLAGLTVAGPVLQHPQQEEEQQQHVSYQGELSRAGRLARRATKYDDKLDADSGAHVAPQDTQPADVPEQPTPSTAAQQQQQHVSYQGELSRAGPYARRATNFSDLDTEVGAAHSAQKQGPQSDLQGQPAGVASMQQHVSYQGELSRAGRNARRATHYGDEDGVAAGSAGSQPPDSSTERAATAAVPPAVLLELAAGINALLASTATAPESNHDDSNMALQSAVAAAAAATSAAHGGASVCSPARARSAGDWGDSNDSRHDSGGPVDMELDEPQSQQLQQQQVEGQQTHADTAPGVSLLGFAKGLEGLEASLWFSPEPVTVASIAGQVVADSAEPQVLVARDGDVASAQQQEQGTESPAEPNSEEVEEFDRVSGSSLGSIPCMYEPLASNSEQHSSASSQADDTDLATRLSDDGRQLCSWVTGEGENLLADRSNRVSRAGPRKTWVDAAAAAMGDSGQGTWAQRRSRRSSGSSSPSTGPGEGPDSEDSADGDVRLRTVRQQHWQQQQQQQQQEAEEEEVLQLEDIDDEDLVVDAAASNTVGRAVQTELPPIRRPYRGLTAADAIANSAAARSGTLSGDVARQDPPGGRWTLGGRAAFAAGNSSGNSSLLRSTFNSTGDAPGPGSSSSRWVVTGGLSSGSQHSTLEQATAAAAAGADQAFSGVNGSYFDKHVLGRNNSTSTTNLNGSASLGPGKYVLSSKGSSSSSAARLDDPAAQYAAITGERQHSSQQRRADSPAAAAAAAAADSDEDPPELRVRTQRLLQQQAAAAAAAAAALPRTDHQQREAAANPNTKGSSGAVPAAAATSKAAAASRKKKGRKAALTAAGAGGDGGRDKSAADARRREREEIEYALYQRGAGSRADSEDDTPSTHLRPSRLSSAAAGSISSRSDEAGLSSTAEAARQLTKCRFKGCKLTFASDLNKHRCQMSHLPSARNTTTKHYKAEVLAFLRALPEAAVAQILQLPEPSQLPRRQVQLQQLMQQHSKSSKGTSAAAAAANSSTATAIERLQGMSLSDAWIEQSTVSDSAAVRRHEDLLLISGLAQLCCGSGQRMGSPSEDIDEPEQEASAVLRQQPDAAATAATATAEEQDDLAAPVESSAASALAAAHAELLHGVCCTSCSAATGRDAGRILECSCSCHTTAVAPAVLLQHQQLDRVIALLDRASEGTFLVNPRLLQQPHTSSCCCSVCVGIVTTAGISSSKSSGGQQDGSAAVMESISSGLDILDIFGEWNVDDASLSYAVERRLVTAFHRAKDAEARSVMAQLLEDTQLGSNQQPTAATAARKKDKKKAGRAAKPGSKKVPAWKAVSSDQDSSGGSDGEQVSKAADPALADSAAAAAAGGVWDPDEPQYEDPGKGKQVAEQLLQVRLMQQDQELHQLRQKKQQAAKQQQLQQPVISTVPPPPPPHARSQSKQQVEQQQQQQQQVRRPQVGQRQAVQPAVQPQRHAAAAAATAGPPSSTAADRRRSQSKPRTPQEPQQQQRDSQMQPGTTRHARSSSGGSGSGGGAGTSAAGPSVLVVPRRRSSDVGSRRMQQPPPPPPPPAAGTEASSHQGTVDTDVSTPAESRVLLDQPQQQQQQHAPLLAASAVQSYRESAAAKSSAMDMQPAFSSGLQAAAADFADHAAGQAAPGTEASAAVHDQASKAVEQLGVPQDVYLQQLQSQQQQALLLQQHCMAFAQQQAYQHVFVASGRAAALAAGQEVPPFTSEEQQLLAEWYAYYYQQAYVAASQHMQLMQRQQVLQQQQQLPAAAVAGPGGDLQDVAADSSTDQQQQQQESPLQLQFGSFPVDFSISSPDVSSSKSAQPTPSRLSAAGAPTAAAGVEAVLQQQQHMPQPGVLLEASAVQHWYHQQYQNMLHQQQQAVKLDHAWQAQQQQQQQDADAKQRLEDASWPEQQQSGVPGLFGAAFLEAVVSALQARPPSSTSSSSTSTGASDVIAEKRPHPAPLSPAASQFDPQMASELLNDRWAAITAVYGLPKRQILTSSTAAPTSPVSAADNEASAAATAATATASPGLTAQHEAAVAPVNVSNSSRSSSAAVRQRLDFMQPQQRGRRRSGSGEGRGRGRSSSSSSSVWRAKKR